MVSSSATPSPPERRRPGPARCAVPSYLAATISRNQRKMVSGVASDATSARRLRPRGLPFSPSRRRSASAKRRALGAEVRAQHTVLGTEVLDGLALMATQPARDQQDEELNWHGGRHCAHRTGGAKPRKCPEFLYAPRRSSFGTERDRPCRAPPRCIGTRGLPGCATPSRSPDTPGRRRDG
jgi:hypothetical protein